MKRMALRSDHAQCPRQLAAQLATMLAFLFATLHGVPSAWADAPAPIPLELNKLEPLPAPATAPGGAIAESGGCRAYMVVTNPGPEPIEQLRLDLILFGKDGVILRRIALDLGPLAARKTAVRLFDLQGQPCDGISRLLVNDVLACQAGHSENVPAEQERQACLDRLQVSSRAKAQLTK